MRTLGNVKCDTDMSLPEQILTVLRGNPMTVDELAVVFRLHKAVMLGAWIRPMVEDGTLVMLFDRVGRADERVPRGERA